MDDIIKTVPTPPKEGYEIDREKSTIDEIVWKPIKKNLTYEDVCMELFGGDKDFYYTNISGEVLKQSGCCQPRVTELTNSKTELQSRKMLAYNKLMNIAEYLNGGWKPDWNTRVIEKKYYIFTHTEQLNYMINYHCYSNEGDVYFKTKELAEQAIRIMGQEDLDVLFKN